MQKEYKSSTLFLTPEGNSSANISNLLGGIMTIPNTDITNSYYNLNTEQLNLVIQSKDIRRKLIDRFDLINSYKLKKSKQPYLDAIKVLDKKIVVAPLEKSGLGFSDIVAFEITITDTSANRAYQMINYFFENIQQTVNKISNEKALRTRSFLEKQLEKNTIELDTAKKKLFEFQKKYKVLDMPLQIKEAISAYASLKTTALMKSLELDFANDEYTGVSQNITSIKQQLEHYNNKIDSLENKKTPDYLVGFSSAPELFSTVVELTKNVEVLERIDVSLKQTLEVAKIQEIKNMATLQVIEKPIIAEYKYKPKRLIVILEIMIIENILLFGLAFILWYWRTIFRNTLEYKRIYAVFGK